MSIENRIHRSPKSSSDVTDRDLAAINAHEENAPEKELEPELQEERQQTPEQIREEKRREIVARMQEIYQQLKREDLDAVARTALEGEMNKLQEGLDALQKEEEAEREDSESEDSGDDEYESLIDAALNQMNALMHIGIQRALEDEQKLRELHQSLGIAPEQKAHKRRAKDFFDMFYRLPMPQKFVLAAENGGNRTVDIRVNSGKAVVTEQNTPSGEGRQWEITRSGGIALYTVNAEDGRRDELPSAESGDALHELDALFREFMDRLRQKVRTSNVRPETMH